MEIYYCPMHPEIRQNKPGKCPRCGGMELVKMNAKGKNQHHHDHAGMMTNPDTAADFLRRFFIVTGLLIPLALFSQPAVKYLGVPDFSSRPLLELVFATVIFYFGLVFFQHAKMEIAMKQYGMMTLVALGVGAGYLFSLASTFFPIIHGEFYLEISTLVWILLFGHFLESKSSTAAGDALKEVGKLLPKNAHLKTKDGISDVEVGRLTEGNIVVVKPGEKVPADGEIVKGGGNFNEAHITGEAKPVEKTVGSLVVAGAISLDGAVEVKLRRVGASSTIGQIQTLISRAQTTKPTAQKLADRAAKWLTVSALSVSIATLLFWSVIAAQPFVFAATLAITVLVIACPHALGLAIPTVTTIATRLAVKNGIFIKDMGKVEIVKRADYVVFDKTGTLTKGTFTVTDVVPLSGNETTLLQAAGAIESRSSHVIASAIVTHVKKKQLVLAEATGVKNLAGRGIEARIKGEPYFLGNRRLMEERRVWTKTAEERLTELAAAGKTLVFVASSTGMLGAMALSDRIKDESKRTIDELHRLNVKVALLTGDTETAAKPIAEQLGIDTVFARVLPEDKYRHIRQLQQHGHVVMMVGDGVNDAPALTQADVGVAIGAGTDVAVEAGDIVLIQSNPQHIVRLMMLSRQVYRKMRENLFWAAGYNIVAIPAAAGLFIPVGLRLTPAIGALFMSLSSVIVVINAMSLRHIKLSVS